ncbi:MAG: hypothetical protein IPJ94_26495 [Chloroflexi bacterium]|nr:hypothetical protein [Chloroflexota bacterium]
MTFQNTHLALPKLLAAIREGYAWTAPHHHKRHHRPTPTNPRYRTTYRVKANVIGSQLLALDSDTGDERSQFDTLLADPFIGQYAGLLHATASSTSAAYLADEQQRRLAERQARLAAYGTQEHRPGTGSTLHPGARRESTDGLSPD